MEIKDISFPSANPLLEGYKRGEDEVMSFFHYNIHDKKMYQQRADDLAQFSYPREELAAYLAAYNEKYDADERTMSNISKLKNHRSVVVVGGQQAGILTGPMYTVNKVLSILKFAKQQEEKLNVPVIPIFWIAGEDHDFAEINHVFVEKEGTLVKQAVPQKVLEKKMASDIVIDKQTCQKWIQDVFQTFGETDHSKEVLDFTLEGLESSHTYADFFAKLTMKLFAGTGLVLMDSASPELRKIEGSFFMQLIEENEQLSQAVLEQQRIVEQLHPRAIQVDEQTAHLFYYDNSERILLERRAGRFEGKTNEVVLTKEELLHIARTSPELLSNNVVTRPLMQEFLLPTLAFIAGPGEVAYWAELKQAFELFRFKMPPIVPRLSYAIVERDVQRNIKDLELTVEHVLRKGVKEEKEKWLQEHVKYPYDDYFEKAKQELETIHRTLRNNVLSEDETFKEVLEKNRNILQNQLNIVRKIVESKQVTKHKVTIKKFDDIEQALLPIGSPQERIWNIFYFLNKYGADFVSRLSNLDVEFNHNIKVVYP
ncbi:bacillithiol biosynthesis cysteine-adding enzyme BshC [Priestia abyssalis]|uniref:bacillithiol biosynthesis cysteine-adding enzyme BshC n=1 Tax=Priestia abyssalis TaxID=1221450 RepID=UPI000995C1AC|nr:bacillithiol biosynthesis cysteine-adding enzyme BshC [Priestia abyssalis]